MRLGGSNAGADLFMDQFPLELRYGCENVHQEFAGRIRLVRIDTCVVAMKRIPMLANS